jgi:hypothetical protein
VPQRFQRVPPQAQPQRQAPTHTHALNQLAGQQQFKPQPSMPTSGPAFQAPPVQPGMGTNQKQSAIKEQQQGGGERIQQKEIVST